MTNSFYSWKTNKTSTGFESIVNKLTPSAELLPNGTYCETETIEKATATFNSRDKAKRHAQKWCKYLKSINRA